MYKIFFIIFIFFYKPILGLELLCKFEEVYLNGQTNNGFLLLKENKLRYEYAAQNLFGLLLVDNDLYYYDNFNYKNIKKTNQNKELVIELLQIFKTYPNIDTSYTVDTFDISIEKSKSSDFIYRLFVKSQKLNLSIYFNDCLEEPINDIFFQKNPVVKYYLK